MLGKREREDSRVKEGTGEVAGEREQLEEEGVKLWERSVVVKLVAGENYDVAVRVR